MFSVIIPTRDRPSKFAVALDSVLAQRSAQFEVIVVNDGSGPEQAAAYREIEGLADSRVSLLSLPSRPRGHGPAFARNVGAEKAKNPYLAFLDDDDSWTDAGHLARAAQSIEISGSDTIDLLLSNQTPFAGDVALAEPVWIERLTEIVSQDGVPNEPTGTIAVTLDQLLRCGGFCHLNTMIVRRTLYQSVGGMDETIRWEEDRDLYLRLLDRARQILYDPTIVARHNIPDPGAKSSASTTVEVLEKRLFQLSIMDKAALFAEHPSLRAYGRRHKGFTLKKIAEELAEAGRPRDAAWYAWQALAASPTLKWAGYTAALACKGLAGPK